MGTWLIDGPQRLTLEEEVRRLDVWLVHGKLHVVGTDGPAHNVIKIRGPLPLTTADADRVVEALSQALREQQG